MLRRFQFCMAPDDPNGGSGGTPPPAPAPTPTPDPTPPPAPAPAPTDWRASLSDEYKTHGALKTFIDKGDINDLAKSFLHAQSLVGRDKVVVPTKNSTPEEIRQYYQKVGLPESRDKYDVKLEGFKDESKKALLDLAYEKNLLPSQVEPIVNFFAEQTKAQQAAQIETYKKEVEATVKELKSELGDAFEPRLKSAKEVMGKLGGEEFLKYVDESGLGNDKQFLKFALKLAESVKREDTFNSNVTDRFNMSKQEATREINKYMGDMNSPYYNRDHPQHKDIVAKVAELHEIAAQK